MTQHLRIGITATSHDGLTGRLTPTRPTADRSGPIANRDRRRPVSQDRVTPAVPHSIRERSDDDAQAHAATKTFKP